MNIFATYLDPYESADYLDNKRVIKMILESAQMMSTTMALSGSGHIAPYRVTHQNHPCTIWVRKSRQNFMWLLQHFDRLNVLYTKVYKRTHKCKQYTDRFFEFSLSMAERGLLPFVNCAKNEKVGLDFTDLPVCEAYRQYLHAKWLVDKIKPTWR